MVASYRSLKFWSNFVPRVASLLPGTFAASAKICTTAQFKKPEINFPGGKMVVPHHMLKMMNAPVPKIKGSPMKIYCANCYTDEAVAPRNCSHCGRKYCSEACQQEDWDQNGHKHYCGRSGELGTDYEIRDSPDKKGLGVFALRDFKIGEIVMVEKPTLAVHFLPTPLLLPLMYMGLSPSVRSAINQLHPLHGDVMEKITCNMGHWSSTVGEVFLMITVSRINHSCIGNVVPMHVEARNVLTLRAVDHIAAGEELTLSYLGTGTVPGRDSRQEELLDRFGFECKCKACTNPDIDRKLVRYFRNRSVEMMFALSLIGIACALCFFVFCY